jgi:hypothetical protein
MVEVGIKTDTQPDDGSEKKIPIALTQNWETYQFALNRFTGVDLHRLYVVVEFVFSGSASANVSVRNVVYLSGEVTRPDQGNRLLIPSAAWTESFQSSLVVVNLDSQPNSVAISARRTDGTFIGSAVVTTLPVGGRYRTSNLLRDLGAPLNEFGPVTIESTNHRLLSAISEVRSNSGTGGFFPGVNEDASWQSGLIPEIVDTGDFGTAGTFRTNLGVNNTGSTTATVTLSFRTNLGVEVGRSSITVPPRGMVQINSVVRYILGSGTAVTGQNGYLELSSDKPIIAWASKIDNGTNDAAFQMGLATD